MNAFPRRCIRLVCALPYELIELRTSLVSVLSRFLFSLLSACENKPAGLKAPPPASTPAHCGSSHPAGPPPAQRQLQPSAPHLANNCPPSHAPTQSPSHHQHNLPPANQSQQFALPRPPGSSFTTEQRWVSYSVRVELQTNSVPALRPRLVAPSGFSGSGRSPACLSSPRRKRRPATSRRATTSGRRTSATTRSPWSPKCPGVSNRSWWIRDTQSWVQVWPTGPRTLSTTSPSNRSRETLASTQVSATHRRPVARGDSGSGFTRHVTVVARL